MLDTQMPRNGQRDDEEVCGTIEQEINKSLKQQLEQAEKDKAEPVEALDNSLDILDKYANDNPVNNAEYSNFRKVNRELAAKHRS